MFTKTVYVTTIVTIQYVKRTSSWLQYLNSVCVSFVSSFIHPFIEIRFKCKSGVVVSVSAENDSPVTTRFGQQVFSLSFPRYAPVVVHILDQPWLLNWWIFSSLLFSGLSKGGIARISSSLKLMSSPPFALSEVRIADNSPLKSKSIASHGEISAPNQII